MTELSTDFNPYKTKNYFNAVRGMWIIAVLWALFSLGYAIFMHGQVSKLHLVIIVSWTICPPLFFLIESQLVNRKGDANDLDWFRQGQTLASGLWIGIGALLLSIYGADKLSFMQGNAEGNQIEQIFAICKMDAMKLYPKRPYPNEEEDVTQDLYREYTELCMTAKGYKKVSATNCLLGADDNSISCFEKK